MDPKFLKRIEDQGWVVESVEQDGVTARCPGKGCGLKTKFKEHAGGIPARAPIGFKGLDIAVGDFDGARQVLRERRETLGLTIREVEELAGIAIDFLAKFERDTWDDDKWRKLPNAQTFMEWAQALGYEFVLRPIELPRPTRRVITQTRDRTKARRKLHRRLNAQRKVLMLPPPQRRG